MRFLFAIAFCFIYTAAAKADVLLFEDFEDNNFNFTSSQPLFHDGTSDYFHVVPLNGPANSVDAYDNFNGSNFFAAEDIADDGNNNSSTGILRFNQNVDGLINLAVDLLFAAGGNGAGVPAYDSNDGFIVRAQLDGGAFQNLLAFEAEGANNQLLRQDTDFDGVGDGFQPDHNFQAYNLGIAGTGTNLLVEIIFTSTENSAEFAIDDFVINATAVPEPSTLGFVGMFVAGLILRRRRNC